MRNGPNLFTSQQATKSAKTQKTTKRKNTPNVFFDSRECIFQMQITCKRDAVRSMDKMSKHCLNSEIYDFK